MTDTIEEQIKKLRKQLDTLEKQLYKPRYRNYELLHKKLRYFKDGRELTREVENCVKCNSTGVLNEDGDYLFELDIINIEKQYFPSSGYQYRIEYIEFHNIAFYKTVLGLDMNFSLIDKHRYPLSLRDLKHAKPLGHLLTLTDYEIRLIAETKENEKYVK